jgi:CRP/FNR family transcriptional regulator, anaerobic regulatory protein
MSHGFEVPGMEEVALPLEHAGRSVTGTSFTTDGIGGVLAALASSSVHLRKGDALFRAGDRSNALYALHTGIIKTMTPAANWFEQVTGFHLPGEIIGVEGLGNEAHDGHALALDTADVGVIPISRINERVREDGSLQGKLFGLLASAIVRERSLALMMAVMRAERRVAWFLLDLGERYATCGHSSTEIVLRMSREEIGSYLGLKLETVSRLFSRFAEGRLIGVTGRTIRILDPLALRRLVHA